MITSFLGWITSSNRNAIIALILSALIGAQAATLITVNVVQDTSEPPVWMQKEKEKIDALRDYNLNAWKKMVHE